MMHFVGAMEFFIIWIYCVFYSDAHSASSSSALVTNSIKFKNPKLDKDRSRVGRKNKIEIDGDFDDNGSKCNA
jgi:hypothetical protein